MALLLDLGDVPSCHCDAALETLHKAMAEEPGGTSIWDPVANPWIRAHVEDWTQRMQRILAAMQDAFSRFLTGEPLEELKKAEVPWHRWDSGEFERVRERLYSKPRDQFTLDDWLLVCEYLVQRYLPDGVIQTEAEYLTVKAVLLGRLQAEDERLRQHPPFTAPGLERYGMLIPMDFGAIPPHILSPVEENVIRIAKARAAQDISDLSGTARSKMKRIIIEHIQAQILGMPPGVHGKLSQRLFDEFGSLNRDMRRIAVTEAGEAQCTGFVASQEYGTRVKRHEAYRGACDFCRSIDGKTFTVVSPSDPKKNGETDVWVGKSNVGRSASPRKREGNRLVERGPEEQWWVAAGVMHPHCRGSWTAVVNRADKPRTPFRDYMQAEIAKLHHQLGVGHASDGSE